LINLSRRWQPQASPPKRPDPNKLQSIQEGDAFGATPT
jgi:hypothetical protein